MADLGPTRKIESIAEAMVSGLCRDREAAGSMRLLVSSRNAERSARLKRKKRSS